MKRALVALYLLSACTRSADPRLYTLVAAKSSATFATSTTVQVRRPTLAGYLDRREVVRAVRGEQLDVASDSNWAEPLDAMIGRVLAQNLALRLPASRVITDLNMPGIVPEARVDLDVQRFEQGSDGLVLRAQVVVRRGAEAEPVSLDTVELVDKAERRDTEAKIAAMNALLSKLADRIATTLASAPLAPPP